VTAALGASRGTSGSSARLSGGTGPIAVAALGNTAQAMAADTRMLRLRGGAGRTVAAAQGVSRGTSGSSARLSGGTGPIAVTAPGNTAQVRAADSGNSQTVVHNQGPDLEAVFDTPDNRRVTRSATEQSRSQENPNSPQLRSQNQIMDAAVAAPMAGELENQRPIDRGSGPLGRGVGGVGGDVERGEEEKDENEAHVPPAPAAGPAEQQEEEPPLRREEDNNNDPPRLLEALSLMTLKNLLPGVSGATLLIEIPIDRIGALKGISSFALYIPKKLIPKARNVYSKYLRDYVEKKTALAELKLFLLPIVIFNNVSKAELKKYATALAQLEKDDW
jgi:hypothetical protein